MATRSKAPKSQKAEGSEQKAEGSGQKAVGGEQQTSDKLDVPMEDNPAPGEKSAPTIHKGVYLSVLVYVEGDQPAPDDFTSTATSALKEALGETFKSNPGGLSMTVKKVEVQNDVEQEEDDSGDKEEKFQF
ncbi:MAG TPA: hypothetical protein VJ183_06660 [Chloroflexia bacterium]|nr:hypothetical protein [Chloroflexia bacterium]